MICPAWMSGEFNPSGTGDLCNGKNEYFQANAVACPRSADDIRQKSCRGLADGLKILSGADTASYLIGGKMLGLRRGSAVMLAVRIAPEVFSSGDVQAQEATPAARSLPMRQLLRPIRIWRLKAATRLIQSIRPGY